MTLADLIPTLRGSLPHPIEPWLWPASTQHRPAGDLAVADVSLMRIAATYGTACHVLDVAEFRNRAAEYARAYAGGDVSYAGKALLTRQVCRWVDQAGLRLDVCTPGELQVACTAGFPGDRITVHGNAKTADLLRTATAAGVGRIVIDNLDEIDLLIAHHRRPGRQKVLLRVIPGVDAGTHPSITTGVEGQKFGLSILDGSFALAVSRVLACPQLELVGLHCHLGSQITRSEPYLKAVRVMVDQLAAIATIYGLQLPELNLGGGFAIAYHGGDVPLAIAETAVEIRRELRSACTARGIAVPRLAVEPGRSIAGPSATTLYRVLNVKESAGRRWVTVDGGMSDNPRPMLYGARYTARLLGRLSHLADEHQTVVGQHCESGDVLIADALLPQDIRGGDVLAVPATGAYHHAMGSNYNLVPRPPIIAVEAGTSRVLVRRETMADLLEREVALS